MERDKREWTPPQVRPLTNAGSRADQADVPAENGFVSGGPN